MTHEEEVKMLLEIAEIINKYGFKADFTQPLIGAKTEDFGLRVKQKDGQYILKIKLFATRNKIDLFEIERRGTEIREIYHMAAEIQTLLDSSNK